MPDTLETTTAPAAEGDYYYLQASRTSAAVEDYVSDVAVRFEHPRYSFSGEEATEQEHPVWQLRFGRKGQAALNWGHLSIPEMFALDRPWNLDTRSLRRVCLSLPELRSVEEPETESTPLWRERLEVLRRWRGDSSQGEPSEIGDAALSTAEQICLHAERRIRQTGVQLTTVVAGALNGGVQVEWTRRENTRRSHVEIAIPPSKTDRLELLRTEETPDGRILNAHELADATLTEVLARFEELLR